MSVFDEVGRAYGMSGDQVITYLARGDELHPDAKPGECGQKDPREDKHWCRLPMDHPGNHNRYSLEELA